MKNQFKKLLDDYSIASHNRDLAKARMENSLESTQETNVNVLEDLVQEKRSELEDFFGSHADFINLKSILKDLIDSVRMIENLLANDINNLRKHNKDNEAVYLLENYREHLKHLAEKYLRKMAQ